MPGMMAPMPVNNNNGDDDQQDDETESSEEEANENAEGQNTEEVHC